MSIVLDLPPELETELAAEAGRLGLPLPDYALQLLKAGRLLDSKPTTGEELVSYWQSAGLLGTRTDITDVASHARNLREQAEKRIRE